MVGRFEHVYIHLPFCEVICHYCGFYTARASGARHKDFFGAIHKEIASYEQDLAPKLKAVYFGGGTPSVSPPELLHVFLERLRPRLTKETEITLEANPTNVTRENVRLWKTAGINRISIGVQSLNDALLKRLGRVHKAQTAKEALLTALEEISNVSGDLIYGVPGQEENMPAQDAAELAGLGITHLSAYHLNLAQKHFLYSKLPSSDFAHAQITGIRDALLPHGFEPYEVASFAKPGFESVNNTNYWEGGPYLALGPSAHGYDGKSQRWHNVADWAAYVDKVEKGESCIAQKEELSLEQLRIEFLFTRLRTRKGVPLSLYRERFGHSLEEKNRAFFEKLQNQGLATLANDHFTLSFSGRMLGDEVAQKLI